jgi:hypothetical protein
MVSTIEFIAASSLIDGFASCGETPISIHCLHDVRLSEAFNRILRGCILFLARSDLCNLRMVHFTLAVLSTIFWLLGLRLEGRCNKTMFAVVGVYHHITLVGTPCNQISLRFYALLEFVLHCVNFTILLEPSIAMNANAHKKRVVGRAIYISDLGQAAEPSPQEQSTS